MNDSKWFYLFMFGIFAVGAIAIVAERNQTEKDVNTRCEMAFNLATTRQDSMMINIANPACKFEWSNVVTTFPDTLP